MIQNYLCVNTKVILECAYSGFHSEWSFRSGMAYMEVSVVWGEKGMILSPFKWHCHQFHFVFNLFEACGFQFYDESLACR